MQTKYSFLFVWISFSQITIFLQFDFKEMLLFKILIPFPPIQTSQCNGNCNVYTAQKAFLFKVLSDKEAQTLTNIKKIVLSAETSLQSTFSFNEVHLHLKSSDGAKIM